LVSHSGCSKPRKFSDSEVGSVKRSEYVHAVFDSRWKR
jgi:hypothetical protein